MSQPVDRVEIIRWQNGEALRVEDEVVREVPLTVNLNGREVVTLLTLGDNREELAVGYLRSEGFIGGHDQLKSWKVAASTVEVEAEVDEELIEKLMLKRTVTTGCGAGSTFHNPLDALRLKPSKSDALFSPAAILGRMGELQRASELYRSTGGAHYAALADPERIIEVRADVGRHNAVDMLGGWALMNDFDTSGAAIFTTGRISSEIVRKGSAMGVGVVASRSAPTSLGIATARKLEITLVGYVRAKRMNVYTREDRINFEAPFTGGE